MKFSLFTDYGALNSKEVFDAFASGITNCGHTYSYNEYDCDVPVIWSCYGMVEWLETKKFGITSKHRTNKF